MVVSRRSFLKRGSLVFLATGIYSGSADRIFAYDPDFKNGEPAQDDDPAPLIYAKATFLPHVSTVFRIFYPNSSKILTTTLVDVSDIGPVPDRPEAGRESFVLKFRGTETLLRQNTYRIEHAVLGRFELFLVPAGKNKQGSYCLAVINRLNG
ncbi:MAG: hypothetical protein LC794_11880 [Acidobacteria bacterium]|nr:hypothetical protein [Acidobacteriota bacterium]MCA1627365.1 hypothetical protein [Acidobacteriota bacterium]